MVLTSDQWDDPPSMSVGKIVENQNDDQQIHRIHLGAFGCEFDHALALDFVKDAEPSGYNLPNLSGLSPRLTSHTLQWWNSHSYGKWTIYRSMIYRTLKWWFSIAMLNHRISLYKDHFKITISAQSTSLPSNGLQLSHSFIPFPSENCCPP